MSLCYICKWFEPIEGEEDLGYCKKNPPVADEKGLGAWPKVSRNEHKCGAFEFNRRLISSKSNKQSGMIGTGILPSGEKNISSENY